MNRLPLVVSVVLAMSCLVVAQASPQKVAPAPVGSVEQQIMTLEQEWTDADLAYNAAWFERHLADSYVGVDSVSGQAVSKASYLGDVQAKNFKAESATISDMKVQVFGDVAVVTGVTTTVKGSYKGQNFGRARWIDTWVRRGGAWQCVASAGAQITGK